MPERIQLDGVQVVVFDTVGLLAKWQECVWDYNGSLKEMNMYFPATNFLAVWFRESRCRSVAVPGRASARNKGACGFDLRVVLISATYIAGPL